MLILILAALAACSGTGAAVRQLAATDAVAEIASRAVIDVRTPAELAGGMIAGATNMDFEAPDFRDRVATLDRNGKYLVYCRTGNRSAQAAAVMAELGFTDIVDAGGFAALAAAGAPTVP
jgi:rhodanese-related sulfurtransferase